MDLSKLNLTLEEVWLPFEPSATQPFGRREVAHLYRRAGFAANSAELDQGVKLGPQECAKKLVSAADEPPDFAAKMLTFAQAILATNKAESLSAWWLHRMLHTPAPLLEKTTLFWHGHFATSAAKVTDAQLMFNQNQLCRREALGKFEKLVLGMARDPAMLLYLDSATNRKNRPNENFAREVMELFCLGVGNYTEKDIQELARAFTGWEIQQGQFKFNRFQHDEGTKTILGKSGKYDGDEALAVLLEQPATAQFLGKKLIRFFITDDAEIPPALVESLARKYREANLTTGPLLKTLLSSRLFYSAGSVGQKVRSPIELSIGLLRSLEGVSNLSQVAGEIRDLGQIPFYPPNVKGWNGGTTWINSSSLLGRANFVRQLLQNNQTRFAGKTLEAYIQSQGLQKGTEIVAWLEDLLLAVPLPAEVRTQLAQQVDRGSGSRQESLQRMLHTLASLPEFQLA